ncbi:MAG: hypothetical protein CL933_24890 [Deltaproteobacteria bacterium]|nr:hypothetical protein [Deltaproteobacteria bacterium]
MVGFELNGHRVHWLHELDLGSSSGATSEELSLGLDALYSGSGLIGFGHHHKIIGAAGFGR